MLSVTCSNRGKVLARHKRAPVAHLTDRATAMDLLAQVFVIIVFLIYVALFFVLVCAALRYSVGGGLKN
jgi:hypothetical protein